METLTGFMRYGGSDAADMTVAGIPALDNFGVWGEKIHSPEEYGELRSLAEMAKVLAIVAVEIEG
jgi:acetylornithine deacetylase/succinyl-diaminopimelate desuccinylase-like protein